MAVLMVSGWSERPGHVGKNGAERQAVGSHDADGEHQGGTGLRVLRFCIPEFYLNKIRVYTDNPLFHKSLNAIRRNDSNVEISTSATENY